MVGVSNNDIGKKRSRILFYNVLEMGPSKTSVRLDAGKALQYSEGDSYCATKRSRGTSSTITRTIPLLGCGLCRYWHVYLLCTRYSLRNRGEAGGLLRFPDDGRLYPADAQIRRGHVSLSAGWGCSDGGGARDQFMVRRAGWHVYPGRLFSHRRHQLSFGDALSERRVARHWSPDHLFRPGHH